MKIRTDFVTNSSSSSFILAFNSDDNLDQIISDSVECFASLDSIKEYKKYKQAIITALKSSLSTQVDVSKIEDIVREEYQFIAKYTVMDKYERAHRYEDSVYTKSWNYAKSEQGQKEIENLVQKAIQRVKDAITNKDLVYLVSFSDDDIIGQQLEHYILPHCDFTKGIYNHH